jgi:hypothetical protein
MLNQDPDPAEPGKYLELRWKVTKFGNDEIKNLTFKLEPKYPFSFDSIDSPIKEIGSWKGYTEDDEYYTLYYKVKVDEDALEDTYDMDLSYSLTGAIDSWTKQTYDVRVGENNNPNLVIGSINSAPLKLVSDTSENVLNINILNIGDGSAENVVAELILPQGFKSSHSFSTRTELGNINAHTSTTARMYVDIEDYVKEGSYETKLFVRYRISDEDSYSNVTLPVILAIMGKPTFEITEITYDKKEILPGDSVKIFVKVKNTASVTADSISIRAYKDSSQPFDFDEKSDYVGTLESGESGDGIIQLNINKDAISKKQILGLEIRSVYNDQVFVENHNIELFIKDKPKVSMINSNTITYVLAGVIVILLGLLFLKSKNK